MLSNRTRDAVKAKFKTGEKIFNESSGSNIYDTSESALAEVGEGAILTSALRVTPVRTTEDTSFKYPAVDELSKAPLEVGKGQELNICTYRVIHGESTAFVLYCLYRDDQNVLRWPTVKYAGGNAIETALDNMKKVFVEWKPTLTFKGHKRSGDNIYLFIEYDAAEAPLDHNDIASRWWWSLLYEIANFKTVLKFPVHEDVSEFFLRETTFLFLTDDKGSVLEIPEVGYYGSYYRHIAVASVMGHRREGPLASLGPYYYFSAYGRAMRYAIWSASKKPMEVGGRHITVDDEGRFERGGLVRFALFCGNKTVKLGREHDPADIVEGKGARFSPEFLANTAKLRDVHADWAKSYDSVATGTWDIDIGKGISRVFYPQIVLKHYRQQYPLAFYYVNTDQDVSILTADKALIE